LYIFSFADTSPSSRVSFVDLIIVKSTDACWSVWLSKFLHRWSKYITYAHNVRI
jgi:hypothetical protein